MPNNLPKDKNFVPIGRAAEMLGVSIDTIRRWDKSGLLRSIRHNGKNRYFSVKDLQEARSARPLSLSETASQLGISATTLRRLDKSGHLTPQRNSKGERVYPKEIIESFLNSDKHTPKKTFLSKIYNYSKCGCDKHTTSKNCHSSVSK